MRPFRSKTVPLLVPAAALALLAWLVGYPLVSNARQLSAFSGDRILPDAVLTDTEAFLPLNVEMIVGAKVIDLLPSPDSNYLLAERMQVDYKTITPDANRPPEGETSLVLWNRRTRRANVVWKSPLNEQTFAKVDRLAWLNGGAEVALAEITVRRMVNGTPQEQSHLLRVTASRAVVTPVTVLREGEEIHVSPGLPLAVLSGSGRGRNGAAGWFRVLQANGSIGATVALPAHSEVSDFWTQDGSKVIIVGAVGSASDKTLRETWFEADPRTGAIHPLPKQPADMTRGRRTALEQDPDTLPVRLKSSAAVVKEGETTRKLRPLWLESGSGAAEAVKTPAAAAGSNAPQTKKSDKQTRALIAADAEGGFLLPDGKTCIYQAQGALYAVPILRVNKAAYLEAHREAMRQAAISNAKQVGVAMMMYAQDYDEMFPPSSGDVSNVLSPYVKNPDIFNDPSTGAPGIHFGYTATGLADIQKPAETIMGYITGPGGRAVIYADGHVKWVDD